MSYAPEGATRMEQQEEDIIYPDNLILSFNYPKYSRGRVKVKLSLCLTN
jgi:hypothetical protein